LLFWFGNPGLDRSDSIVQRPGFPQASDHDLAGTSQAADCDRAETYSELGQVTVPAAVRCGEIQQYLTGLVVLAVAPQHFFRTAAIVLSDSFDDLLEAEPGS